MAISLINTGIQFPNDTQTTAITYTWLNSTYFNAISNCGNNTATVNCYGSGNIVSSVALELIDSGGTLGIRSIDTLTNCNCDCACTCE